MGTSIRSVEPVSIAFALFAASALAFAQSTPPPYVTQFQMDARHTGRTSFAGPRTVPSIVWRVRARHRVFASPVFTHDDLIVFAGIDGGVHALDRNGVEHWAYLAPHPVFATPAVWNDETIVGFDGGAFVALDAHGAPVWTYTTPEDADAPPTLDARGQLYVASRGLAALDGGHERWVVDTRAHLSGAPSVSPDASTVIAGDVVGTLWWVRASDGHVLHRVSVGAPVFAAPLVLDDGTVVVGARDGHVRAYAADSTLRWDFATQDEVHGSAALARDGSVVVGSDDGTIYDLHPDGTLAWRVVTNGRVRASPRVDRDGYIYVGSEDDTLYAIDPHGHTAWTFSLGADIDSSVLVLPWGGLAVGCDDDGLYLLEGR